MLQSTDGYAALTPIVVEAETILDAGLHDAQLAAAMGLSYAAVEDAGWESGAALDLLGVACENLAQWCLNNGRYAYGVTDAPLDNPVPLTEIDRRRDVGPPTLPRWLLALTRQLPQRKRYAQLPTWSMLAGRVQTGDALLVAAWLDVSRGIEEFTASIVDYDAGPSPRHAVPLNLSYAGRPRLHALYRQHASTRLPCRILGMHSAHAGVCGIDVLQLEVALPLFEPPAGDSLTTKFRSML